ncbi:MAG: hypothetical protein AAF436_00590 [Myxococcota bacterium]
MTLTRPLRSVAALSMSVLVVVACDEARQGSDPPLAFAAIDPILEEACLECHGGEDPSAGYSVEDYLATIRCIPDPDGQPATLPADTTAPILAVLDLADHADLLDDEQTDELTEWILDGAWPARRGSHPGQWMDPRTDTWHGTYLRDTDWLPIVDPSRGDACGLCHAGSPAPVADVTTFAPGATDCTACHDLPGGVLACGTCHGDGLRPYPPRDQCYFPGAPFAGAHPSHVQPSANLPNPLGCASCHFGEDFSSLEGSHGDGTVDVVFQPAWGPDATYDFDTQACATTCHVRGGTTPEVAWDEADLELDCNACHMNPPAGHAIVACNGCHRGINPEGTRLTADAPHINGRVDAF